MPSSGIPHNGRSVPVRSRKRRFAPRHNRRVLWNADEHVRAREGSGWSESAAEAALERIRAEVEGALSDDAWPTHPLDEIAAGRPLSSLYLGSAGTIWALHRLGTSLDLRALIGQAISRYRRKPDFDPVAHAPSLWMGESGLLTVAHAVGAASWDQERLGELIEDNREHPTWELMWGSPGTILAARACGLDELARSSVEELRRRWSSETDLWTQHLYGETAEILGPPHGFAGAVIALRGAVPIEELRARVTRALERTALREGRLVNWPPSAAPPAGFEFPTRMQWCHGAPGIVACLADLMPLELALAGAEAVCRAGPLRKGFGLCHGTAGNGYALLKIFSLTADELWLERARCFAIHAVAQLEALASRGAGGRYSLWTGSPGVALFLRACLDGHAGLPTIDYW